MDYYRNSTNEMVICPYDKTYVIRKERLSRHLIKCARNNKTVTRNFSSCEFNHSHKIKRGDGSDHYKYCEDKRRFDAWLERDLTCSKKGNTSLPKYEDVNISNGENWDEELEPFYSKNFLGLVSDIKKNCDNVCMKKGNTSLPTYNEVEISSGENWDEELMF